MWDNSSDLIRVREPERTEDEMMAGLNIRVTQPVPYIQSDKIVQPALVMLQQEVMTGMRRFHDNDAPVSFTAVIVSGRCGWLVRDGVELTPREALIRCSSQTSTSLCNQRELRPNLVGFGNSPSLMSL